MPAVFYIVTICALVGLGIAMAHVPMCQAPRFEAARRLAYAGIVTFAIVPITHWMWVTPAAVQAKLLPKMIIM